MPQTSGARRKTRSLLRKRVREHGMKPLSYMLIKHSPGDRVVIDIDPSVHKGMPYKRFQGKIGTVKEIRGRAYVVAIEDGDKAKLVISRAEHLKLARER